MLNPKNKWWTAKISHRMKKMRGLSTSMFFVVLFFVSGIAEGANWERISDFEDTVIYIDSSSMKHISEAIIEAQFKIEYKEPSWINSKSVDYYLIRQENNCNEKKYKVYQVIVHFNDGTNYTYKTEEEYNVKSDTFQSVINEFICKK